MTMSEAITPLRERVGARARAVAAPALVAVPRRRPRPQRVPFVVMLTAILVGGVIGLLLFNTSLQQSSFAASALQEQSQRLDAREQTLQMELDALRDPQRVAQQAQRLGMVPAGNPAFLDLRDGSVKGKPTPATRENAIRIQPLPPRKPDVLNPAPRVVKVLADTAASTTADGAASGHDGADQLNETTRR